LVKQDLASSSAARATQTGSVPGTCGGNFTYSITTPDSFYDGQVVTVSGYMTFNAFCEMDVVVFGSMNFSATFTVVTVDPLDIIFGPIDVSTSGVAVYVKDPVLGQYHGAQNLNIQVSETDTYVEVTISGQFCHYTHGCVTVSTPTPLRFLPGGAYPYSGVLRIEDSAVPAHYVNIVAGSTQATVTAQLDSDLDLEVNGTFNWGATWTFVP
jgi:hypothetical protein